MDKMKHLIHANSNSIINGKPKQPSDTRIKYGELAVNYKKGSETIFIKNDEDEISSFSSDAIINQQIKIKTQRRLKFMGNEIIEEIEERPDGSRKIVKRSVEKGISFGSALAMVISFVTWKSIGWAIFHGALGWIYVIYYFIKYR